MGFFTKHSTSAEPSATPGTAPQSINGDNTVKEWLNHPVGGAIFRDMLAKAGQKENVLRPVHRLPLTKLVAMSRGQFTQEMLQDMIEQANAPAALNTAETASEPPANTEQADDYPNLPEWQETITPARFEGKTIIVTGAGSGIGKATASRVAREGGRVIAVDISQDRLKELADELSSQNITVVSGDITEDKTIENIVAAAGDTIDGLANVAGIMDNMTPLHEMSDEIWIRVINVNLVGMMKLSRAVIPKMLDKNSGTIVNVGSEASLRGSAAGAAYTTSKHAVVGLTKSCAYMYGPYGIRTNMVAPGAVLTNIEARYDSKLGEQRVNSVISTIPDAANPDALAASISFLLSQDSANINGAILPSDGGWSAQ